MVTVIVLGAGLCVCVFVVSILWRHSTLGSKMGSEMEEAEQGNQEGKING